MSPLSSRIAWLLLVVLAPPGAEAQVVRVGAFGVAATNAEVEDTRQARGLGAGVSAEAEWKRLRVEGRFVHAALQADFSVQPDYNVDQFDVIATWYWRPYLAVHAGLGRRFMSPELVAQDVGLARIGVRSDVRLASVAGVWVRGAYLPFSRFSGGGSADLGLEIALGVEVGAPASRFLGFATFEYQRLDREAAGEAPLQFSVGQIGAKFRL